MAGRRPLETPTTGGPARPLLEVIALTVEDARAAEEGGADRLELVRAIDTGGLTPDLEAFEAIRAAVDLPLRVMLRSNAGFAVTPRELDGLCRAADALSAAGADQFVFGFLNGRGDLDLPALATLIDAVAPCSWTLHHAFDHARDPRAAWEAARSLPGLDCILTGGIRGDLGQGLQALIDRAAWQSDGPCWLVGGGLRHEHLAPLRAAGITHFHTGRAVRRGQSWSHPVDPAAVRRWRDTLDGNG